MCERQDSIAALGAAADRLTETCDRALHAPPDPAQPVRGGVAKAIRTAIRELSPTPPDMALQLRKLK